MVRWAVGGAGPYMGGEKRRDEGIAPYGMKMVGTNAS